MKRGVQSLRALPAIELVNGFALGVIRAIGEKISALELSSLLERLLTAQCDLTEAFGIDGLERCSLSSGLYCFWVGTHQ